MDEWESELDKLLYDTPEEARASKELYRKTKRPCCHRTYAAPEIMRTCSEGNCMEMWHVHRVRLGSGRMSVPRLKWCDPPDPYRYQRKVCCRLCGDRLHKIAHQGTDEFVWVDETNSPVGMDLDLRHLQGSPYARLKELADTIDGYKNKLDPDCWRASAEYISLKVRMEFKGMHHVHQPNRVPAYDGDVPEHCDYPMWLRPSGWYCRRCKESP